MKKTKEITNIIQEKLDRFEEIVRRQLFHIGNLKTHDIVNSSEVCKVNEDLGKLFDEIRQLREKSGDLAESSSVEGIQNINNKLSVVIKNYGTAKFTDFMYVCFNSNYYKKKIVSSPTHCDVYAILDKYFHPIRYKVIVNGQNIEGKKGTITQDFDLVRKAKNLECFAIDETSNYAESIHGMRVVVHNEEKRNSVIVYGIVDDIGVKFLVDNCFIKRRVEDTAKIAEVDENDEKGGQHALFDKFMKSLVLRDYMIMGGADIYSLFERYLRDGRYLINTSLTDVIKMFTECSLTDKRVIIIQLLILSEKNECEYMAYLLYDLLNKENGNNVDSQEQIMLYDSLPIYYRNLFKLAMKNTLSYTEALYNYSNNVPLEQQICLLKAGDNVKEKAIVKLKEVQSKSEDSGSKARQYLEGLLKIPFGNYAQETIMTMVPECLKSFNSVTKQLPEKLREKYSIAEQTTNLIVVKEKIKMFGGNLNTDIYNMEYANLKALIGKQKKSELVETIKKINSFIKNYGLNVVSSEAAAPNTGGCFKRINYGKKSNPELRASCEAFLTQVFTVKSLLISFINYYVNHSYDLAKVVADTKMIEGKLGKVDEYMKEMTETLDASVYGHREAKKQIQRIIGQWLVGENSGYCFGFEGPPGVGKTSLAQKGISKCLVNSDGKHRPFSFIAIGGSSNGSTLEGHNYTYVGSTWGKIVDILMDSKCMNPIIFIDELDKISATENGKEIIGILTHLIDSSQNSHFQDKYFNGVDLDLSKALFIFSYNDPALIDRILLDRIHRVKFDRLTMLDKLEISERYLIKEITQKLGLKGQVRMSKETIRYLINTYTNEPGVRKLKEIMFELFSEINLDVLDQSAESRFQSTPIDVTQEIVDEFLKNRYKVENIKVAVAPAVGLINGLWANTIGQGGVLPIEATLVNAGSFLDLKLTGMQGDVMKESMAVAKTVAWNLLSRKEQEAFVKKINVMADTSGSSKKGGAAKGQDELKSQGIHIHCPDGATPKDGPSAGAAITTLIYSVLTQKKIKNKVAITGEINLRGNVTKIGGLDLKVLGGIDAGANEFIYPRENEKEYQKLREKFEKSDILRDITFHSVDTIHDVLKLIMAE